MKRKFEYLVDGKVKPVWTKHKSITWTGLNYDELSKFIKSIKGFSEPIVRHKSIRNPENHNIIKFTINKKEYILNINDGIMIKNKKIIITTLPDIRTVVDEDEVYINP
jgi:hypothetical protein